MMCMQFIVVVLVFVVNGIFDVFCFLVFHAHGRVVRWSGTSVYSPNITILCNNVIPFPFLVHFVSHVAFCVGLFWYTCFFLC